MVFEYELINFQDAPLQFFDLSDMPVIEKLVLRKRLKTELALVQSAVENIVADCERRLTQKHSTLEVDQKIAGHDYASEIVTSISSFCSPDQQPSLIAENHQAELARKSIVPELNTKSTNSDRYSNPNIAMVPEKSDARSVVTGVSKGSDLGTFGTRKGEKMDSNKTRQCANALKVLMNHPVGWVFNQPVDPVKLQIPDYFSIISHPMDLGTVKHKLASKQYSSTGQFAADVRLTFSNAMRYNPPGNEVHVMAKELNNIFNSKWKLLEAKCKKDSTDSSLQSVTSTEKKKQVLQEKPNSNAFLRRSITSAEKLKLKKELSNLPVRRMPSRLLTFLQSKCIPGQVGDFIDVDIDMFDEETLCELHQIVKNCSHAATAEKKKCIRRSEQDSCKGTGETLLRCGSFDESMSPLTSMTSAHRTVDCQFSHSNDISQTSSSEILPCDVQLSPSKALRAAMLRSRFADTILKAQHRSLGEKVDPAKLQREREKLEKKQQEEKARIEAQVKAAEIAAKMKAEDELKIQREKEREAARLALQKMKKTVEIDNSDILKELENLGYPQPSLVDLSDDMVGNFVHEFELQSGLVNPLEQLGLFMKKEDVDAIDDYITAAGNGDVEEGEINYL
ncbi:transcription factor GTE9-like [Canna indica]|uniref:Transcription factor GTE9-like n=1 Tax=Canna indica TaxID=4628 RepID=A0AAQ3KKL8_9LILI|nr:transcription factor GTE9-like [Canna indica]